MASEGFLIGPGVRDALRTTIARVHEMPYGKEPTRIPTRFEDLQRPAKGGSAIRAATFTGSWSINSLKELTFQGVTSTPNTVLATNQLYTIGDACTEQVAYIGKVSSLAPAGATAEWHLLNVQHHETAVLVSVTLTTAALEFTRRLAWIPYPGETSVFSIQAATDTSCSS